MRQNFYLPAMLGCLFFPLISQAAEIAPNLVGSPVIQVDRLSGRGKEQIYLRNSSGKDLPVSLTSRINCVSKVCRTHIEIGAPATGLGSTTLNANLTKATEAQPFVVFIQDAWDPGDTEVDLLDNETRIGTFRIRRPLINIKLDGANPDHADLPLTDGVETRIIVRNEDPVSYSVDWVLFAEGSELCGGKSLQLRPNHLETLTCRPNVNPEFSEVISDQTRAGNLFINEANLGSPLKVFPVTVAANYLSAGYRHGINYILIFIILIMGGLFSLILSQALPNKLEQIGLKQRLLELAKKTADLTTHVDSKLAALVRIERLRILDLLDSQTSVFPDFTAVLSEARTRLADLAARIGLLQQIDIVMAQLRKIAPSGVAPTLVDRVNENLDRANVLLGKQDLEDADFLASRSAVSAAKLLVDQFDRPDVDFGQSLSRSALELKANLDAHLASTATFQRICGAVPTSWSVLQAIQAKPVIAPELYRAADIAITKITLIRDYSRLFDGTKDCAMLQRLKDHEQNLTGFLQLDSLDALDSARLLVREMREDIYPERLRETLHANDAVIDMDPAVAYGGALLQFCICFRGVGLNHAGAREEWVCNWNFGDGRSGKGWEIAHYFDWGKLPPGKAGAQRSVTATCTFLDSEGKPVVCPEGHVLSVARQIDVNQPKDMTSRARTFIEAARLLAALLIAVFGLIAGARDQLAKLDLVPGLVAIFLVGFGADTIKNILTGKPSGTTDTVK